VHFSSRSGGLRLLSRSRYLFVPFAFHEWWIFRIESFPAVF
jgi:hypothetical protein